MLLLLDPTVLSCGIVSLEMEYVCIPLYTKCV